MPQHDLDVAPGSGLAVRSDINAALVALGTTMKGPAPPPAPQAGMMWLEDDNPSTTLWTLRMFDGVDWIVLGLVDATANLFVPANATPVGAIGHFPFTAPPAGWLKANGAAISRIAYAPLFAALGTMFGAGDGSTTFNLPDLRAEFIRGWDDGRGIDGGRVLGTLQAQDLQAHTHTGGLVGLTTYGDGGNVRPTSANQFQPTGATGGAETRPRNVSLLACIKF